MTAMLEFLGLDGSTIAGGVIIVLVLAFLRFGNRLVDLLLAYSASPVETIEETLPEHQ